MSIINYEARILKLADFLEVLQPALFEMSVWQEQDKKGHWHKHANVKCGTAACALGWATAVFPRSLYYDTTNGHIHIKGQEKCYIDNYRTASSFFNIPWIDAHELFRPSTNARTPKTVSKMLRDYVTKSRENQSLPV